MAPGEFVPASQVIGYEARDASGVLQYVQDTHGSWIKASYEVAVPDATAEDWTNVNDRLGSDFTFSPDRTSITGVEGLSINKNGEATFNFDGKAVETYHLGNIKVQEINGVKRLLVAGYAWNGETKSWEVFNPGFPMENPKDELGWFNQADIANGNWLRWHQRATENIDMEALFSGVFRLDSWGLKEDFINKNDYNGDGKKDIFHENELIWTRGPINDENL